MAPDCIGNLHIQETWITMYKVAYQYQVYLERISTKCIQSVFTRRCSLREQTVNNQLCELFSWTMQYHGTQTGKHQQSKMCVPTLAFKYQLLRRTIGIHIESRL